MCTRSLRSLGLGLVAAGVFALPTSVSMAADHRDAPLVRADGRTDINDVYAFRSPTNSSNSVIIVTTNPFVGVLSPKAYSPSAFYDIEIYNNGDAIADVVYRSTFSAPAADGSQTVSISRNGVIVAAGAVGSTLAVAGGGTARAGTFDDPFFFDLNGFNNGLAFTGSDFFAGANTNAIVLEVPSTQLGGLVGIQARTADAATNTQIDRMGRPAINTALIPSSLKDAFNAGVPGDDLTAFGATVLASITSLSNASNAAALTPVLLPDLLTFDTSSASGFLNGRRLADDVIDAELNLLSAGAVTGDGVNANDRLFSSVFPYLAAPNDIPEPTTLALFGAAGLLILRRLRVSP